MKIILGIFCALMVLFAGGCAVILLGSAAQGDLATSLGLSIIPGVIAALNLLVLLGLFGKANPPRSLYFILAGLDFLAAAILMLIWIPIAGQYADVIVIALPLIALILVKGVMTVIAARRMAASPPEG